MSRTTKLFALFLAPLAIGLAVAPDAQAQVSVEGAWTATEWTVNGETQAAQRGIFIFTSTHYSFFFVGQRVHRNSTGFRFPKVILLGKMGRANRFLNAP